MVKHELAKGYKGGHLFVSLLVPLVSLVMWIKSGEHYNDMK
jgi:hypothetical protein